MFAIPPAEAAALAEQLVVAQLNIVVDGDLSVGCTLLLAKLRLCSSACVGTAYDLARAWLGWMHLKHTACCLHRTERNPATRLCPSSFLPRPSLVSHF